MKGEGTLVVIGLLALMGLLAVATNPDILSGIGLGSVIGTTANWGYPVYMCVMNDVDSCDVTTDYSYLEGTVRVGAYGDDAPPKGTYSNCEVIGKDWQADVWEIDSSVTVRRKVGGSWKIIRLADQAEYQDMICQVVVPEGENLRGLEVQFNSDSSEVIIEDEEPPGEPEVVEKDETAIVDVVIDGVEYQEIITSEDIEEIDIVIIDNEEVTTRIITDSNGEKHLVITTSTIPGLSYSDTELASMMLMVFLVIIVLAGVVMLARR